MAFTADVPERYKNLFANSVRSLSACLLTNLLTIKLLTGYLIDHVISLNSYFRHFENLKMYKAVELHNWQHRFRGIKVRLLADLSTPTA
jgi:hypothetical protein